MHSAQILMLGYKNRSLLSRPMAADEMAEK